MAGPPRHPLSLAEVAAGSENERLGVARDSMLRNPRILKAELGKPLRNCYTLPGLDFSYGLYIERTDGGVPEAIGHWNTIKPRTNLTQNMPRDFITMNRGALKAGYTTAREFNLYYKAKDIRCKDDEYSRFRRSPPHVPADRTYGIPARPSTPLFDLLQHKYKELWMEQQRARTAALRLEKTKTRKDKVRDTRTTLLRKNPVPPKEESFWHLPHLEKVGPHLSTFPDCDARKKAFSSSH
ncbi:cilia- and flagella-associated protein 77 [Lagopus muta]|uniref:cilia- and flagella-associated protein 77 n=1 Tax=Lagopus leucura TaxID=30410 RepID=UPI001C677931|nr:cilia- and flagella-associated protein 77 [Lagopus leucura]XP_048821624.1 cilia- and flagella-associated protein 77 [Lagopus muta]